MKPKIEYHCIFSALPGLQTAHQMYYRLYPNNARWYVQLECRDQEKCQEACFALQCPQQKAEDLLRFLYENAVPPECALALAEDTMPEAVIWPC